MTNEQKNYLNENIAYLNETLIPIILEKWNPENQEEVKENLEKNLPKIYHDLLLFSINENCQFAFEQEVEYQKTIWQRKSMEEIKQDSIYDEPFEIIKQTSLEACGMAQGKMKTNQVCQDLEKYQTMIAIWKENEKKVKPWNQEAAEHEISEGYVDLNFAYNFSDNISLRLSNFKGGEN